MISKTYCDINSCHQTCQYDNFFWLRKFSRVLWLVYTVNGTPRRSVHYFLSAHTIASNSFSCVGIIELGSLKLARVKGNQTGGFPDKAIWQYHPGSSFISISSNKDLVVTNLCMISGSKTSGTSCEVLHGVKCKLVWGISWQEMLCACHGGKRCENLCMLSQIRAKGRNIVNQTKEGSYI